MVTQPSRGKHRTALQDPDPFLPIICWGRLLLMTCGVFKMLLVSSIKLKFCNSNLIMEGVLFKSPSVQYWKEKENRQMTQPAADIEFHREPWLAKSIKQENSSQYQSSLHNKVKNSFPHLGKKDFFRRGVVPQMFLSDPSPIIGYACQWLPPSLTHWLRNV